MFLHPYLRSQDGPAFAYGRLDHLVRARIHAPLLAPHKRENGEIPNEKPLPEQGDAESNMST